MMIVDPQKRRRWPKVLLAQTNAESSSAQTHMKQDFRRFEEFRTWAAMMMAEDPKNSVVAASDTNAKQENEKKEKRNRLL